MTLNTQPITLTASWQQITDGVNEFLIQRMTGVFEYVIADTQPPAEASGHKSITEIVVTPPSVVWCRNAALTTTVITVSKTS